MQRAILGSVLVVLSMGACGGIGDDGTLTNTEEQALSKSPPTPIRCVDNVACIQGTHWDARLCRCVPDRTQCVSGEDGPCGGFIQNPCTCAAGLQCVPNRIPDIPGTCEPKRCCPAGYDMYQCNEENGTTGFNCHNPALACASSLSCGAGCDTEVSGRCPVCDPLPCSTGEHWDLTLCRCVPDPAQCVSGEDGPCGGFTQNPCTCGDGLHCVPNRIPDIPGTCEPTRCCPAGYDMYQCNEENGTTGFNCHNPAQGCPSSLSCGAGCDLEVSGRCPVCDPLPCPTGEHWDLTLCACVAN